MKLALILGITALSLFSCCNENKILKNVCADPYVEILVLNEAETPATAYPPLSSLPFSNQEIALDIHRIPECIGNLENLKILDLKYLKLTSLPDTIRNLQSLEVLILTGNKLLNIEDELPKLKKIKNLKFLEISLCDVDPISIEIIEKKLNEVKISCAFLN